MEAQGQMRVIDQWDGSPRRRFSLADGYIYISKESIEGGTHSRTNPSYRPKAHLDWDVGAISTLLLGGGGSLDGQRRKKTQPSGA